MKKVLFLMLFVAMFGTILPLYLEKPVVEARQMRRFSSYNELKSFLEADSKSSDYYEGLWQESLHVLSKDSATRESNVPDISGFSKTNIQVEGVDEADVLKTDGEYIYIISGKSVIILKAYPPRETEILSQIKFNGTLRGVFINDDRLVIFEEVGSFEIYTGTVKPSFAPTYMWRTFIEVYDVTERANPVLTRNVSLDGSYFNSRMISNYVYAVINKPAYIYEGRVTLPTISSNDRFYEVQASDIFYSKPSNSYHVFTTIVAINVQDDEQEPAHETFLLGAAHNMYVSLENIYITLSGWSEVEKTLIHRIHVDEGKIKYEADGEVLGNVLNQFSMDEYNGYFRIATTTSPVWRGFEERSLEQKPQLNHIYVLDKKLKTVGKLEDLAPTERIYSARFICDRCYLVTFRQVDPFFVIDLKNPYKPEVLGQLKIPGFSSYLHPYDENHIIGIGKEASAVKISLFDVSNVSEPKEMAKYVTGYGWADSPVLSDHKALLFDRSKGLLVMPISLGHYAWQGASVFNISLDEGLVLRGKITHIDIESDTILSKSHYYSAWTYHVKRCLYIDNVLYTISDKNVKMNSLENLEEINQVELP